MSCYGTSLFSAALRRLEGTTGLIVELVEGNDMESRSQRTKVLVWSAVNAAVAQLFPRLLHEESTGPGCGPGRQAVTYFTFFCDKFRAPKCAQRTL
jgi:hypothetical protein